ncbi:MAG TPA: hypothetical protein PLB21_15680, partial [Actinomycetota bacterium]|nr:hypothetical protein [Actinomycetota bacterium]
GLLATAALFLFEPISVSSVLWLTVIALVLIAGIDFLSGIGSGDAEDAPPTDGATPTVVIPTKS